MEQVTNKSVYSFNYVVIKTNFLKVVRQGVQVGTDALPCNSSIVITIIFKECQYIKVEICILNSLKSELENQDIGKWRMQMQSHVGAGKDSTNQHDFTRHESLNIISHCKSDT